MLIQTRVGLSVSLIFLCVHDAVFFNLFFLTMVNSVEKEEDERQWVKTV